MLNKETSAAYKLKQKQLSKNFTTTTILINKLLNEETSAAHKLKQKTLSKNLSFIKHKCSKHLNQKTFNPQTICKRKHKNN